MTDILAPISRDVQRVLANAKRAAKRHKQPVIAPGYLLLGLLQLSGCQAETALTGLKVNLANLTTRLEASLKLEAKGEPEALAVGYTGQGLTLCVDTALIMEEALAEAQETGLDMVDTRLLVLGMLRHPQNTAGDFLQQYGVTLLNFREQAQLTQQPVVDLPRLAPPKLRVKLWPVRISPIFGGLVLFTALSGYLCYANVGNPRRSLFLFVTGAWVISVALHEFGHALVAYWSGDDSVVYKGYLTLDPLKYTHPFLSIALPVIFLLMGGIGLPGGAVYINRQAIHSDMKRSLVSAAGPIATMLCTALVTIPFWLGWYLFSIADHFEFWAGLALVAFLQITAVFINLLPIPGLDGFGILEPFLPPDLLQKVAVLRPFTFFILYGLLWIDTPIRDAFWDNVWEVTAWINWDLAMLVGEGFDLFRFWIN